MDDLDSLLLALGINDNPQEEQQSAPQSNEGVDINNTIRDILQSEPIEEQATTVFEETETAETISDALNEWARRVFENGHGLMEQVNTTYSLEPVENMDLNIEVIHDPSYDDATTAASTESPFETPSENPSEPVLTSINIHNDDSARFSGAEWFSKMQEVGVSIIGLGGIGSWLALLLSRLKVRAMYCKDMDRVEAVNLAGQLYQSNDVGSNKTEAVRNLINRFNDRRPSMYMDTSEFTVDSHIPTISYNASVHNVMLGLDSITARQTVYNYWKNAVMYDSNEYILIDGRLTADKWQIFAIPSKDQKRMEVYEREWLFPQSEAQHLPCSFKQTTYMAAMIASYMCNLFVNFIAESTKPIVPYSIPFMTEFDAQTFEMKTYECE